MHNKYIHVDKQADIMILIGKFTISKKLATDIIFIKINLEIK
jgi:hypothetical protein